MLPHVLCMYVTYSGSLCTYGVLTLYGTSLPMHDIYAAELTRGAAI